jgi:hypothetical protein
VPLRWTFRRARHYGRGVYCRNAARGDRPALLFGVPRWAMRRVLESILEALLAALRADGRRSFAAWWYFNVHLGYLMQAWSEHSHFHAD